MNTEMSTAKYSRKITADVIVVGGGLAGLCAAISSARNGAETILIQDRPMPGGNASSEIRMWICGSHVAEYREGGLVEMLKLANHHYNPSLKYTIWDHVMRDALENEPKLQCFFNTSVRDVKCEDDTITSVLAWGLTDYTEYEFCGKIFADCSGDSILALSGADYVTGREDKNEYNEPWGMDEADKKTMGNSVLMQLRKCGVDTPYRAPKWAYHYTEETVPREPLAYPGDNFWWLEFGGIKDTIGDAAEINRELIRIALGYWEYIKNHPDGRAKGWTMDWVGSLPGKRENRRYVGDYVLTQNDAESTASFDDAVAYGCWSTDDHAPEAIYHTGGPNRNGLLDPGYHGPYRCLYSRNIKNLMFAGRNISASHLALSAVRVMATCGMFGQAAGTAAALACKHGCTPRELGANHLDELQQTLMLQDQFLPRMKRRPGAAAAAGIPSDPRICDGVERDSSDPVEEHSITLAAGASCSFTFEKPVVIGGFRAIWDSDFSDPKRMLCNENDLPIASVPATIAEEFVVEVRRGNTWSEVAKCTENYQRLNLVTFSPCEADEIRLTVTVLRNADTPARLFAFEPLD